MDPDVLVVGGGPAGRALAAACGERGLRTILVDRAPRAPWTATYGAWADDLPASLPATCVAARARAVAFALTAHDLGREYAVLDVPALRAHLDARLDAAGVRIVTARVVRAGDGGVLVAGGEVLLGRCVVDAGGHRRPLAGRATRHTSAEQSAYGIVVPAAAATPLVRPGEALFMDWRPDHGDPGHPSFLYGVPVGGDRVLLEETSLARRPGLPLPVLRARLRARLARHGVATEPEPPVERVRFPLDQPRHRAPDVVGFGAAAPFVHPASGFSVAVALRAAPAVAEALAAGGVARARRVVWPAEVRAVHRIRRIGLEALLRMPAQEVPRFFETFLGLDPRHQRAYLDGRGELRPTLTAMAALFARSEWRLRRHLVVPTFGHPVPHTRTFYSAMDR